MNNSFLKPILGDELFAQVSEKLTAAGITLINAADGSYIPKGKFDEKVNELRTQAQQITTLQTQLAEEQKKTGSIDGLNQQITKLTADVAQRDASIQSMALKYDVKDALRGMNARNADVILPLLNMDGIKRGADGKTITGLLEQVEALKKSDAYLFDAQPGSRGGFNGSQDTGAGGGPNAAMNAAIRSMSGRV